MPEEALLVPSGDATLAATLTLPDAEGPCPVVLCLHGSGPLDRDENMPAQRLDVFNVLAADLARRGVATLRYDKRGVGESTGDYYAAGQTELLADAIASLDYLDHLDRGFTKRIVLGHSEGTLLAARLSLVRPMDGLVLLNPFAQPMEEILMAQAAQLEIALRGAPGIGGWFARLLTRFTGGPVASQRKLLGRLRSSTHESFRVGGQRVPARSLRELIELVPAEIYAAVTVPCLVLGGEKDLQCSPEDVARVAELIGHGARAVVLDDLTHVLRRDAGEHTFLSYAKLIEQPVDPEVVEQVGAWVTETADSATAN